MLLDKFNAQRSCNQEDFKVKQPKKCDDGPQYYHIGSLHPPIPQIQTDSMSDEKIFVYVTLAVFVVYLNKFEY